MMHKGNQKYFLKIYFYWRESGVCRGEGQQEKEREIIITQTPHPARSLMQGLIPQCKDHNLSRNPEWDT